MMYFGKIVREFHEMIRMSHVVACPITFILLCDQSRKGEVLRIMKNGQLEVFSVVVVCFFTILGSSRRGSYYM